MKRVYLIMLLAISSSMHAGLYYVQCLTNYNNAPDKQGISNDTAASRCSCCEQKNATWQGTVLGQGACDTAWQSWFTYGSC